MISEVSGLGKVVLPGSKQAISLSNDASLALPRILCLHGGGTNGRIFKTQCRGIRAALAKDFRLVFAEAPYPSNPGPDVTLVYGEWGPFKSWIPTNDLSNTGHAESVDKALTQAINADDLLGATGEWIAVLGFSQGAKLAASLLLRQQQTMFRRNSEATWSDTFAIPFFFFGIIMAGRAGLLDLRTGPTSGQGASSMLEQLDIASIHVHGLQDPGLELHRDLMKQFRNPVLVEWDGGHRLPIKPLHVGQVVDNIRRVARHFV